jgi:NAD-specific glutamate dehydrogenase
LEFRLGIQLARPQKFLSASLTKVIFQIECREVDCTKSDDPEVKSLVDKYSLKQYPTVIAVVPEKNGKETRVDYEAKVKKQYLDQFVSSLTTENG